MIDLVRLTDYVNLEHSDLLFDQNRIVVRQQHKWTHRGHTFNEGMLSEDGNYFYLNISKNNSSFMKHTLTGLGWQYVSLDDVSTDSHAPQVLVVLRDPVQRWISGIVEYLFLYHVDVIDRSGLFSSELGFKRMWGQPLALDLLCKNVTFDDHTEKQCVFLQGVDLNRVTWFHAQHEFNHTLENFLNQAGYQLDLSEAAAVNQDVDQETFSFHNKRRHMKAMFTEYLQACPAITEQIRRHYACDYHLMESVTYYGS